MRNVWLFLVLMTFGYASVAHAQTGTTEKATAPSTALKPLPADIVVKNATGRAAREKKAVFLHFGASWCGWCRRLEKMLDDPEIKPILESNYVIITLDVLERGDKKALENVGGDSYLTRWKGEKSGLPFTVFLDKNGKKLADTNVIKGSENIGYPGTVEEIAAFVELLKKTAPRLSPSDSQKITDWLIRNAPK